MSATAPSIVATTPAPQAGVRVRLVLTALFWGGAFIAARLLALEFPHCRRDGPLRRRDRRAVHLPVVARRCSAEADRAAVARNLRTRCNRSLPLQRVLLRGARKLSASHAALIIATNPALTAVAAWLVFRQRFVWWQWVGVATAFAGVAIVVSHGDIALVSDALGLGEILMFGGAASWVVYTLVGRSMMQRRNALSPLATTAYASGVGLLMLATAASFELPQVQWSHRACELVAVGYLPAWDGGRVRWFYEGVKGSAQRPSIAATSCRCRRVLGVLRWQPLLASMIIGGLVTLAVSADQPHQEDGTIPAQTHHQ
jgi:hypothetical protein